MCVLLLLLLLLLLFVVGGRSLGVCVCVLLLLLLLLLFVCCCCFVCLLFWGLVFALREFAELFRFVGFSVVKCSSVRSIKQPLSWLTLEGLALFTIIRT